jgi:hypothetical protein
MHPADDDSPTLLVRMQDLMRELDRRRVALNVTLAESKVLTERLSREFAPATNH